jgi:uncharacterized protein DUF742
MAETWGGSGTFPTAPHPEISSETANRGRFPRRSRDGGPLDDSWELGARVIRPYILTGGRTRPAAPTLAVEAMLEATGDGLACAPDLPPEQRHAVTLCRLPLSVAEVASRLSMPLGVVRVLVAEMVDDGWLHVFDATTDLAVDVALLQRLIARVKAIPA